MLPRIPLGSKTANLHCSASVGGSLFSVEGEIEPCATRGWCSIDSRSVDYFGRLLEPFKPKKVAVSPLNGSLITLSKRAYGIMYPKGFNVVPNRLPHRLDGGLPPCNHGS